MALPQHAMGLASEEDLKKVKLTCLTNKAQQRKQEGENMQRMRKCQLCNLVRFEQTKEIFRHMQWHSRKIWQPGKFC